MPVFFNKEKFIFFIHIPKVGGASIEAFLRKKYKMYFHSTNYKNVSLPCSPQHFHSDIITELLHSDFLDNSFTLVRDPLNRFISEYKYRMDQKLNNEKKIISLEEFCFKTLSEYSNNPFIYDNHIRPQVEFLHPNTRVYKFENGLIESLKKEGFYKDNESLPHVNNSQGKNQIDVDITDAVKEKIFDFYNKDYERFLYLKK